MNPATLDGLHVEDEDQDGIPDVGHRDDLEAALEEEMDKMQPGHGEDEE